MLRLQTSKFICSFGVAVLAFFASAVPVSALTISPARIELSGDPGQVLKGEFLLINEAGASRTFYTSSQNFEAQGETGTPTFTSSDEGLASWVSVPSQVTLSGGEQRTVSYEVTIPESADPGGYFAAVFLSSNPPASSGQSQVSVGAKIGTLLLLRVSGDVAQGGAIASFDTKDGGWFYTKLPVMLAYRFTNSGGDRVNPEGTVTVRNMFGIRSARFDANPTKGNVLPGSTRKFEVSWGESAEAPKGFFGAVAYQWQHFALGVYHVQLKLSYGAETDRDGMFVAVLPWQLLIVLIAIGIAVWFGGAKLIRRYNRWIIKKAQQHSRG